MQLTLLTAPSAVDNAPPAVEVEHAVGGAHVVDGVALAVDDPPHALGDAVTTMIKATHTFNDV